MDALRIAATGHGFNNLPECWAKGSGALARRNLEVDTWVRDPWPQILTDVADGTADMVQGGLWVPAMYAGRARNLVVVGQMNARLPWVLVTRKSVEDFDMGWMVGRTVLVPGAGGLATYEFTAGLLREAGIDPGAVRFVRSLSPAMVAELFELGLGDGLIVDVVIATRLVKAGFGYATWNLADAGGSMPNTIYYVRRDRVEELHDRIVRFLDGLRQAMVDVNAGTVDSSFFTSHWPELDLDVMESANRQMIADQVWGGPRVDLEGYTHWMSILRTAGVLDRDLPYDELVDSTAVEAGEMLAAG
jgi:NitT/TauT family transport system substrate-binding protein